MRSISYILLSLVALSKVSIESHIVKPQFVTDLISSIGSRVVGGTPAQPNGIPYQAHLSNGPGSFCGASIIRDDAVLTAAHCVSFGDYFDVTIGDHNLDKDDGTEQIIRSRAIVIHEKWDPSMTANDIAILFLSEKIKLNSTAKIIRLNANKDIVNREATVSGWGRFSDNSGYQSNVLLYGTDYLISNKECDRYFGWYVTENIVCLNGERGRGSCNGDSGGPLVIKENGETVLAGIVSFGSSIGCEKGYPSAFTRVSNYLNWIDEKLYQN